MGKTTGDQQQQMGSNKIVLLILATSEVFLFGNGGFLPETQPN
jgi:hypothetical protein